MRPSSTRSSDRGEGRAAYCIATVAQLILGKQKGDMVHVTVAVPQFQGNRFAGFRQGTAELKVH